MYPIARNVDKIREESILYETKECISLLIKHINKGFQESTIRVVRQTKSYVILADFGKAIIWLVELNHNRIEGIRRY